MLGCCALAWVLSLSALWVNEGEGVVAEEEEEKTRRCAS